MSRWERRELLLAGVGGGTGVTIASAGYGGLGITVGRRSWRNHERAVGHRVGGRGGDWGPASREYLVGRSEELDFKKLKKMDIGYFQLN